DFELTDEQRLIRETARDFTDREIVPVARDNDRNERFDLELVGKLGEMGYLGPIVDEEYGGRGLDYRTYARIVEEGGRGDSFAQTDPEKKHRGLACFLVPTESEGFSSSEIHGKLGLRASDTAELSLDGVQVGEGALLGEVGDGFKVAMSALDSGRYSVAAGCVGICQGCVNASVDYSKERQQFGRPIASFQLVQQMIADMVVDTEAARSLVWRAGWLKDTGQPNTTETSVAK